MQKQVVIYTVFRSVSTETSTNPIDNLRQAVENRGDTVVGTFVDYGPQVQLRQRNTGWKSVLECLDGVDQVVVMSAGDLPGKSVRDLLRPLGILRDHGVSLFLVTEGIDTDNGSTTFLDLIAAYRAAKLSQAIRRGIAKTAKRIGRPAIPQRVVIGIQACLALGAGVRPTARKFNVSPASVISIRRSMSAGPDRLAA
jgi:DNA invertase Pin-like site-specific DNA recombinase